MSPRYKPQTLEELGLEAIFERRNLDLRLFKLLVRAANDNTAIANALSEEYKERIGIPIKIAPATIKRYRKLI